MEERLSYSLEQNGMWGAHVVGRVCCIRIPEAQPVPFRMMTCPCVCRHHALNWRLDPGHFTGFPVTLCILWDAFDRFGGTSIGSEYDRRANEHDIHLIPGARTVLSCRIDDLPRGDLCKRSAGIGGDGPEPPWVSSCEKLNFMVFPF